MFEQKPKTVDPVARALRRVDACLAGTGMAGLSSALFAQSMDPVYAAYEAASQNDPWTLITRDAPAEGFDGEAVRLHGRIPDGLRGTLFRTPQAAERNSVPRTIRFSS